MNGRPEDTHFSTKHFKIKDLFLQQIYLWLFTQYVVQGKIDLKGPIEFEGYLHDENTDVEKEQSCTRKVRGTVGSREKTHTHTAMREGLEQPRARLRTSTPRTQLRERARENSPQGGAKDGKREG